MKNTLLGWGIISLFLLFGCSSNKVLQTPDDSYSNIVSRSTINLPASDMEIDYEYEALINQLKRPKSINKSLAHLMRDSLKSIYLEYRAIYSELDSHGQFLIDSIAKQDPQTGKLLNYKKINLNTAYWMGNNSNANDGRGNGKAIELKNLINGFREKIEMVNKKIALESKLSQWYIPYFLEDVESRGKMKSWEKNTFEGPVIASMATLEAMKLDQLKIMDKELKFFKKILDSD